MVLSMVSSATKSAHTTPAGGESAGSDVIKKQDETAARMAQVIATGLPPELRAAGLELLRAIRVKVAVAEHFDAFCSQAFAKPEWAAAASPVVADLFEEDEDLLAELTRIPDLIIEMSTGQVAVTCMVASRWAARGETHRLSRLADALVASRACKNPCAVEVMLALAATLAVTRLSRAEQLFHAAQPLVKDEHQEAVVDAKRWLAVGRIVCSIPQEERDFWDVRLRRPKTLWSWENDQERRALVKLAEQVRPGVDGLAHYEAIVPRCWWDLAMHTAQQLETQNQKLEQQVCEAALPREAAAEPEPAKRAPNEGGMPPIIRSANRGRALFVIGWASGAMAMALTVFLLPQEIVKKLVLDAPVNPLQGGFRKSPAYLEDWRQQNLKRMVSDMAAFAPIHMAAKSGSWRDNEKVLSGHSEQLTHDSPDYVKLLVWLHLDPPSDVEVRRQVARLLLERVKVGAITLWEELVYPGSANALEIKDAARAALTHSSFQWSDLEKSRLAAIAERPVKEEVGSITGS